MEPRATGDGLCEPSGTVLLLRDSANMLALGDRECSRAEAELTAPVDDFTGVTGVEEDGAPPLG